MSKGVVEGFGDVGVAGGDEGGGEVNVGITEMEFTVMSLRSSSQRTTALVAKKSWRFCRGDINERPGIL